MLPGRESHRSDHRHRSLKLFFISCSLVAEYLSCFSMFFFRTWNKRYLTMLLKQNFGLLFWSHACNTVWWRAYPYEACFFNFFSKSSIFREKPIARMNSISLTVRLEAKPSSGVQPQWSSLTLSTRLMRVTHQYGLTHLPFSREENRHQRQSKLQQLRCPTFDKFS